MTEVPVIAAEGAPDDIGYAVGHALSETLQAAAERHRTALERGVGWERALAVARWLLAQVEPALPACVAELRGMSAASGVPLEVLFSLNALQETQFFARRLQFEDTCTSLAVPPAATRDGSVLLAHNEDAGPSRHPQPYVLLARPKDEPAFLAFAYSGLFLYQGFNDAGIASTGNALTASDLKPGFPKLLAYREVLRARTLEEAIRATCRPERANGNNHLIATREGEIYDIEVTGQRFAVHYAGNRPLAHTNHVLAPELREVEEGDTLNSQLRLNRVRRLLEERSGELSVADLQSILRDHANWPRSVCKHAAPADELAREQGTRTVASLVVDVTAGTLYLAAGAPCQAEYVSFTL